MTGIFKSILARIGFPLAADADSDRPRRLVLAPRGAGLLARWIAAAMFLLAGITASQPALADNFTLWVDWHGLGSVTVSDSLGGSFDCSGDCMPTYPPGTVVTLTPSAAATSFWMWDVSCSGFGTCELTMIGNRHAQAKFKFALRINVEALSGSVSVNADQSYITLKASIHGYTYNYPEGTSVAVTATAKSNHEFTGWDGACSGTGACNVVMTSDQTVDANFKTLTFPLQVNILSYGDPGIITSSPSGISCPPTCTASFDNGQSVTLSASANTGYTFGAWGDPPCSGWGLCTVTMNSSQSVDGAFEVKTTTKVSGKPAVGKPGQAIVLTATVKPVPAISVTLPGSVTFKDGSTTLGQASLNSGTASLSVSNLAIGSHTITAQYSSGSIFFMDSSGTGTVKVSPVLRWEQLVNTFKIGAQQFPAVAALKSGYVIVWASNAQDGNGYGVYGQRYYANGAKRGAEMHISTTTKGNQSMPKVAGLTAGGFVVVWQSDKQDANTSGIYAQAFTAAGAKSGVEFKVNTTSAGNQTQPAIVGLPGGGFAVAWTSAGQDGSGLGVYAQLYDAKAKASGKEFKINTTTVRDQSAPALAATNDGGFVAVWQAPDANGLGIFAQRYNSTGKAVGRQFAVNKTTASDQSLPSVAGLSDGGFVAVWQSKLQDGSGLGVYAQAFKSTGAKNGGELKVNSYTKGDQWQPQVAAFSGAGFVVLWTSNGEDGSGKAVIGQLFGYVVGTTTVVPSGGEFLVNVTVLGDQWQPAVATSGNQFMAAWTSRGQDRSLEGVYSELFSVGK